MGLAVPTSSTVSVRDLLEDLDVRIVAGHAGLDGGVRWVHVSELADPTPWLSGGELLLTTGLALESPDEQRAYLHRLADHGLAGLGLGTGFAHPTVPEALLEAAREREFPLFDVPYEVPFIAVTEKAAVRLVNEQYAVLQRALAAHERLERIVLSERGLDGVAGALAALLGGAAVVLDGRGEPLAVRTTRRALPESDLAELGAMCTRHTTEFTPGGRSLALPVARAAGAGGSGAVAPAASVAGAGVAGPGSTPQAWLIGLKDAGSLTEFDRLVLHQAVTIVALELLRRRVAGDTERRLAGDVLSAVLTGELAGRELTRRLTPFGLRERVGVLVLTAPRQVAGAVEEALADEVRETAGGGLVAQTTGLACALLPIPRAAGDVDEAFFATADRIRARVAARVGIALPGGAGRAAATEDVRRSLHEARCALEARALGSAGGVDGAGGAARPGESDAPRVDGMELPPLATYRDLGSFQLLLALQDDDALRLFCDSVLGPIERSEGAYGGELMRSLEAFIECNGQWEKAAKRLYCHRHTLRYRVRRVEELTGRSLDSARDRIDFWLALRGRELIA